MNKKNLFLMSAVLVLSAGSLASCGTKYDYTLKIWCATKLVDLTKRQANAWYDSIKAELGKTVGFDVQAVGEGDAASNMILDVEAGADIFCFAQDQTARLVSAGALQAIENEAEKARILEANDETSITAATVGDELVCYPLTSDNGYFMYYDKTVLGNTDMTSMDAIVEACRAAKKKLYFEVTSSAWYSAAYFFGAGCVSEWTTNNEGLFVSYNDTYQSVNGVKACQAMYKLINSNNTDVYVSSADGAAGFGSDAAVVVSGIWDYTSVAEKLGDKLACVELPNVTIADGSSYHLGSFMGCKLLGVKPQEDVEKLALSQALAEYLSGEQGQLERFNEVCWGPSNKNDQKVQVVKDHPGLKAIEAQKPYAQMQGQYPGGWWTAAAAIGGSIASDKCGGTDAEFRSILATYAATMDSFING